MASSLPPSSSPPHNNSPLFDDDDEDNYQNLMSAVTLTSTPHRKRTAHDAQLDDNDSETPPLPGALVLQTNGNHLRMISSYATRKHLRPEQLAEVESFLRDPPAVQMARIFIDMKATKNALNKFQATKPQFEINAALKINLTRAVNAILCSSQITHYKGDSTKSEVQVSFLVAYTVA
jgi:hypothetical protein